MKTLINMKAFKYLVSPMILLALALPVVCLAQTATPEKYVMELPQLNISDGVSLHIISPEPIQFVDLSTDNLIGDLPAENIARVKTGKAGAANKDDLGIITVVGQSFMAQYKVNYKNSETHNTITQIQIQPEDMQPLEYPKIAFSNQELYNFSMDILKKKTKAPLREVNDFKLSIQLNNVYVISDYIFLDISFINDSNLSYNIDGLKFSIEDKKIYKATNNQSLELKPEYQLYRQSQFKKNFHNIYVFKKFTYPNSKVMVIRLIEEPISGRTVEMKIKYSDILKADTF
ncbi:MULTISPECIES: conjugative transposon protein TraN [Elizabethkingia]|uniref:Conjugative transposon protein TraN n=3 Tax=Elizabethkingia anophelis TaxID=1117645 RepID=A0A455ZGB4_9FLAO|nr:conjugative transposon protein TraN [Elizabethkingia anophelis]ATC37709.1 conjugative transposon protein TraN [Elizabethkingia anophelis R26]ATC41389.1 conjugative transposon protein TraN [Elizabethkingia anophelis Ag1]ATC45066.1 conjugative transposon protein TraN [Elizabethkingia anophelis]ATC48742.1 conjugative transposon protein TraN [Elizabethkingia anophelis]ELR81173.1 conjugative transposon TraN protein [Elizabethkingia anophelis R26]